MSVSQGYGKGWVQGKSYDYYTKTFKSLLILPSSDLPTRTHNLKLFKKRVNTKKCMSFFTNRIINIWNGLPSEVVNADGLNAFKNKIDILLTDNKYCTNLNII